MHQYRQEIQSAKQAYTRGEYDRAVAICNQLLTRLGARDDLLNIKALALLALGQVESAEASIRQALKLDPGVAGMHLNAATIYKARSLSKLVKRHAMEAIRLAPRDGNILYQAAWLLRDCRDYSQALRVIDRCLQIQPDFSHAWHLKGSALIDLGKTELAQTAMEKSVELEPGNAKALCALVKVRGDGLENHDTVALLKSIQSKGSAAADRASAAFTLGKMHHRDGQHDLAFSLFEKANALAASSSPFNLDAWQQKIRHAMQASAEAGILEASQRSGGKNLVFIIGMPRSGTTLCEHVLSANTNVLACGELTTMEHIEDGFTSRNIDPYQLDLATRELEQAATLYLSSLPKNYHRFRLVTDKAPLNFERIGLIRRVFPQARFLYCVRHPLDTIFSCFMQDFQSGLLFASNLEHIAQVYIDHVHLMRHWIKLLPENIHVVNYEQYVADPEVGARAVADFLHLDFEEEMLKPHLQNRAVVTASNMQVRRAVYSSSIGRWKNYRSQMGGVIALLQKDGILDVNLNSLL